MPEGLQLNTFYYVTTRHLHSYPHHMHVTTECFLLQCTRYLLPVTQTTMHKGLQLNNSYYTCSQLPRPQCTKGYNWTIHTMLQDTFTQLPRPQCMKGYIWMLPTTPAICMYTTTADQKLTHHGSNLMPLKSQASLQDVTEPSKTVKESSLKKGLGLL